MTCPPATPPCAPSGRSNAPSRDARERHRGRAGRPCRHPAGGAAATGAGQTGDARTGVAGAPRLHAAAGADTAALSLAVPGDGMIGARSAPCRSCRAPPCRGSPRLPGGSGRARRGSRRRSGLRHPDERRAPLVVGVTLLLGFLLLLLAFRSFPVAAAVLALNCLSVAAAGGTLVLIFQHRWAEGLLGFTSNGAITDWLPLFGFVLLFGLSMDYTRADPVADSSLVRAGRSGREAGEAEGVASTAATVTGAAPWSMIDAVLRLRHARSARTEGAGRRPGGGRADRRDHHPRRGPARGARPAGRAGLGPRAGRRSRAGWGIGARASPLRGRRRWASAPGERRAAGVGAERARVGARAPVKDGARWPGQCSQDGCRSGRSDSRGGQRRAR